MKNCLILVKHSLPEIKEHVPAREWHLSEDGKARAELLAQRLHSYHPEVLVSSPEPKAKETAEIVGRELNLEVQTIEDLREHDRSTAPYLSKDEFQNAVHEFFLKPGQLVFGSETADEAHTRFSQALQAIVDAHPNKTIIVVSHGTVISLFVSRLTGLSDFSLWNELGLPSFVLLDINSNTIIERENVA